MTKPTASTQANLNTQATFSKREWLRYTRHIQLPQIGANGQSTLKNSHVLIVGAGGLGSPVSFYLAAAGVGKISLIDHDSVDLSNLQRQILFTQDDISHPKAQRGAQRLRALNPDIEIIDINTALTKDIARPHIEAADLVLDCTDNFATRYLINDLCSQTQTPWIYASIHQFSGQCALFTPQSACFRCLFPDKPIGVADCNSAGVLGVLPGLLGTLQANEALKFLVGLATPLENTLLLVDALDLHFQQITLAKNPECPCCFPHAHADTHQQLSDYYQAEPCETSLDKTQISAEAFHRRREEKNCCVIDVRTKEERQAFHLGGKHISLANLEFSLDMLEKDKTYLMLCQSGIRSVKAQQYLQEQGYFALSVEGGLLKILKGMQEGLPD